MKLKLKIWRQKNRSSQGYYEKYDVENAVSDMSVLELLDHLNTKLAKSGVRPVEFDHDCREGICGQCGFVINGRPQGLKKNNTTCLTFLRDLPIDSVIQLDPFRAQAFPVICDLKVDRTSLDRVIQSGGYISINTGSAPEANTIPIRHDIAEQAFDSASCIGCGACVAACKNSSAALFTAAKITHLNILEQGKIEAKKRTQNMVRQMSEEGFGSCSFTGACEAECPQSISITNISFLQKELIKSIF